jgi:thiosulfate dehydrogenase [quinone] large subunit
MQGIAGLRRQTFEDPKVAKVLFGNPLMGFAWFFLRVFLGWQWLSSGWGKVYGDTAIGWTKDGVNAQGKFVNAGDSILGFWNRAAAIPQQGTPPIRYDWYRDFLQYMIDQRWNGWFTYVIAYGEVIVGVALILGAFTGISALFGATMNLNFMLAGTASTNPVLFTAAIFLVLGWKVAGYVGLDRYLLPALGTPWQAGQLFHGLRSRQPSLPAAPLAGGAVGD